MNSNTLWSHSMNMVRWIFVCFWGYAEIEPSFHQKIDIKTGFSGFRGWRQHKGGWLSRRVTDKSSFKLKIQNDDSSGY